MQKGATFRAAFDHGTAGLYQGIDVEAISA